MQNIPDFINLNELTEDEQRELISRFESIFSKVVFIKEAVCDFLSDRLPGVSFDVRITDGMRCELSIDKKFITEDIQTELNNIVENIEGLSILDLDCLESLTEMLEEAYFFYDDERKKEILSAIDEITSSRHTMSM